MPILEVEHICKSFEGTEVLKDISFSLEKSQVLSIIGSSGSGKTTLLRCLNFLERPDGGIIKVNGEALFDAAQKSSTQEAEIRKKRLHFGLVFQSFNLFPQYTALENVMLAKELLEKEQPDYKVRKKEIHDEIEGQAVELLKDMGLADRMGNYPHQLSGGQCQRVAIARALALRPDILCFDEPTSALDPELTGEVLKVIKGLADQKMTMIIVTHEMAFARDVANQVVFMDNGFIVEQGTPDQVFGHTQKNGKEKLYPASIVKLLTALVTAEEGKLDDIVIFSYDAVYGVEEGSGNALQLETGDKLTVEDCMYAMLLKSSNQAANALAEYVAGSNEKFAEHMNEKAQELGCTDSNFVNPSGLNAEEQKVTAEDMAKIAAAAFSNDTVREIASAKTYQLPVTLNNPNGCIVEMEHQLLNGTDYSYKYAYAGKTGYTDAAGNTLVTAARKDDKNLIAVVLKSEMTHYTDTIKLFNYGFAYLEQQTQEIEAEEESVDTEKVQTVPEEQKETTPDHTVINVVKGIFFLIILYGASLIFS